jgi:hypothetical protein
MNRLTIALGAVIAITAMLAIPNAPAHFARASSCSSSANTGHSTKQTGVTGSGSCATSSAASGTPLRFDLTRTRLVVLLAVTLIAAHQIRSVQQQQQAFKINPHQAAAFHVARTLHNFLQASQHYFNNILQH